MAIANGRVKSSMSAKCFFDTNVPVYAVDGSAGKKQQIAVQLLRDETQAGRSMLSTQVLQEFYVTVTRKLATPMPPPQALEAIRLLGRLPTIQVKTGTIYAAAERAPADQLSFWDALIVEAALDGGCTTLYSEDLQDGRRFGALTVINPFR